MTPLSTPTHITYPLIQNHVHRHNPYLDLCCPYCRHSFVTYPLIENHDHPHNPSLDPFFLIVGIHLSHNGDFDALEAFSHTLVVDEVGLFLERVLHVPNDTKGA